MAITAYNFYMDGNDSGEEETPTAAAPLQSIGSPYEADPSYEYASDPDSPYDEYIPHAFTTPVYSEAGKRKSGEIPWNTIFYAETLSGDYFYGYYARKNGRFFVYMHKDDLVLKSRGLKAVIPEEKIGGRTNKLVDVRTILPDASYNMVFATENNYIGYQLYPRDLCLLQYGTAMKLRAAQEKFLADGYSLRLYDAYRPASVQKILYDKIRDTRYVANPSAGGSDHNKGAAVDILLTDMNGNELKMPTAPMVFENRAQRAYSKLWTDEEAKNVNYMTAVMQSCGFGTITTEWWHFYDLDKKNYPTTDLDFKTVKMEPIN